MSAVLQPSRIEPRRSPAQRPSRPRQRQAPMARQGGRGRPGANSPARRGVSAPSVREPLSLRQALGLNPAPQADAPIATLAPRAGAWRLTERGMAVIAGLLLMLLVVSAMVVVAQFVQVTSPVGGDAPVVSAVSAQ